MAYSSDGVTDTNMDDNGNLVYAFLISSQNESLIDRDAHVGFTDFGIWNDTTPKAPETEVPGTWALDFTLTGVVHTATYVNLSQPIADTGRILTSANISPHHSNRSAGWSADIPDTGENDVMHAEPLFIGVVLSDGHEEQLVW